MPERRDLSRTEKVDNAVHAAAYFDYIVCFDDRYFDPPSGH